MMTLEEYLVRKIRGQLLPYVINYLHASTQKVKNCHIQTKTPAVIYTRDMFYMASNVSSLVNVRWFFGIPFNDSVNWRLQIAEESEKILGKNLLGLQAGNEPDFYVE